MAILGESFYNYVKKQIDVRQNKLSLQDRNDDILKYITSKTSFLRLTSGVDINKEVAKNLGVPNLDGSGLAKQYVLEAARFKSNPNNVNPDFTSGVGYTSEEFGNNFTTSYGFNSDPNFGLIPPPGLISATINTLNRGTIREATINLICHNLYQFKIINALFLKLKYSLLLEWGHTLYFDSNTSNIQLSTPINIPNLSKNFLTGMTSDDILSEIEENRNKSCGNYDAFFGVVKNFNWELQENGSYNVMINAISQGDVIESLKVNSNLAPEVASKASISGVDENMYKKSTLHYILGRIMRVIMDTNPVDGFKTASDSNALNTDTISSITDLKYGYKEFDDTGNTGAVSNSLTYREGIQITFPKLQLDADGNATPQRYIKLGTLLRLIESFLLYYNKNTTDNSTSPSVFYINHGFNDGENECITCPRHVSVDPLTCVIPISEQVASGEALNNQVTYFYTQTKSVQEFFPYIVPGSEQTDSNGNTTAAATIIEYEKPGPVETLDDNIVDDELIKKLNKKIITSVTDSQGNIIPDPAGGSNGFGQDYIGKDLDLFRINLNTLKQYAWAAIPKQQIYVGYTEIKKEEKITTENIRGGTFKDVDDSFRTGGEGKGREYIGQTMHIYVNINKIIDILDNNIDSNGNVTVYNFLTQLLNEISQAMGCINKFDLDYNEATNTFSVIDTAVFPLKYQNLEKAKTAKFNINLLKESNSGGGSFVTNFGLKSDVFGQISNAIAIGAQGNGNTLGSNSTPISNFNTGLTDRIITYKQNPNSKTTEAGSWAERNPTAFEKYSQYIYLLTNAGSDQAITTSDIDFYRSFLVDLFNYDLGYYTENNQIPGTGFIPLNLHLTMDGLSGMRQYQTFDIDETLLPNEYNDRLKFITTTITHKIDTKGWETTINSLGVPKNNKERKSVDQNTPKVKPKPKPKTTETNINAPAPANPISIDTSNINSNIRKAIVEEAQKYFNLPSRGESPAFVGFTPDSFEADLKSVGWYADGGTSKTHWCNWFTMLCWRNAYVNLAKTDPAIANINSTYFDNWKITRENKTITAGVPRTFSNMLNKGYAEQLVVGQTVFYPGDMVIYSNGQSLSGRNHIGLCIDFDPTTRRIKTIGGNESNRVRFRDWFKVDEFNTGWRNRVSAVVRVITP